MLKVASRNPIVARLLPPGPELELAQGYDFVAELRAAATRAEALLRPAVGSFAADATRGILPPPGIKILDRSAWVAFGKGYVTGISGGVSGLDSSMITPVLAFVSTRILGQYDPLTNTLALVAPNIYKVSTELKVAPKDFGLWVSLHEQTHYFQNLAAPWLYEYLRNLLPSVLALGESEHAQRTSLIKQVTALMSVIEGHAEVMMDRVGQEHISDLETIRKKFDRRRARRKAGLFGFVERAIISILGLEEKMAQYKNGQVFVATAIELVGLEAFNQIFEQLENMPTEAELKDPPAWVTRVVK